MAQTLQLRRVGDRDGSFVLRYFEEFYTEVSRQKDRIRSGQWKRPDAFSDAPGAAEMDVATSAQAITDKLYQMLDRQAIQATRMGGEFGSTYYQEAQFVMAALADEVFLNLSWEGRQYWEDHLLESRLFGTHDAGDLFFRRLDQFLAERDILRKDLAEVYLLALGLGFQGKFRNINDDGRLAEWRRQLYVFINHRTPALLAGKERLFPDSYAHTLATGDKEQMQDRRLWYTSIASVFFVIFLFSHLVWERAIEDVSTVSTRILNLTKK
ncbi:MAG: DotU family type IV/VI secretion system protein [Alphaproteobacteria bacterium]|nr:DotU family type IV/VI secretion system protein [Alphaproteobacteria bacterium]